jgi:hypothetical protein
MRFSLIFPCRVVLQDTTFARVSLVNVEIMKVEAYESVTSGSAGW